MNTTKLPEHMTESYVAIVLTDIIGSTKFVQRNGAKVAAQWFAIHDKLVMNLITRFNGQWVDNSDGHLMYFGSIQDSIAFAFEYKKFLRSKKFPFRSRIGIHWDKMILVRSDDKLVRGGGKRINLEGIGKNIAARTMSICGEEQILLSHNAFKTFKTRKNKNRYIPKRALSVFVGLYKFKGVKEPEQIYAMGLHEIQLQPPKDGEKAKRIGGKRKVKIRLRHKRWREIFFYFLYRLALIELLYFLFLFWPLLSSSKNKRFWAIDYWWLEPFEWINTIVLYAVYAFQKIINS